MARAAPLSKLLSPCCAGPESPTLDAVWQETATAGPASLASSSPRKRKRKDAKKKKGTDAHKKKKKKKHRHSQRRPSPSPSSEEEDRDEDEVEGAEEGEGERGVEHAKERGKQQDGVSPAALLEFSLEIAVARLDLASQVAERGSWAHLLLLLQRVPAALVPALASPRDATAHPTFQRLWGSRLSWWSATLFRRLTPLELRSAAATSTATHRLVLRRVCAKFLGIPDPAPDQSLDPATASLVQQTIIAAKHSQH